MAETSQSKRQLSGIAKTYLIGYNVVETIGWTCILVKLLIYIIHKPDTSLYEYVKWEVIIFQNAAVLEILHAAIRIVPSSPIVTAQQVFSRVLVVCGVLIPTLAGKQSSGLPLALFAWSITEIIRYLYYALNLVNIVPYPLTWLRYTTFYILYPIGVTGELLCLFAAQREVSRTALWSVEMPNTLNFCFYYGYFLCFVMLLYVPLFPQMYLHMMSQRKKILGGSSTSSSQKTS